MKVTLSTRPRATNVPLVGGGHDGVRVRRGEGRLNLHVHLRQERHITTVRGGRLVVREGKVRVVQRRRDDSTRDARARALGLSNADADPRENASPEDKAPEDSNAAEAAPPKVGRRRRRRTSSRSTIDPLARARPASGVVVV